MGFDRALQIVLRLEGGMSNDPRDPGGLTNHGISSRAHPQLDVATLTHDRVVAIYREDYWHRAGCDALPEPLALAVFDAAVNQGPETAVLLMQRVLGVRTDGIVGPKTAAAATEADVARFLVEYAAQRWRRYREDKNADTYLAGWTRRLFEIQAEALWLAAAKEA